MNEPRTEAGRRLLASLIENFTTGQPGTTLPAERDAILEAEARDPGDGMSVERPLTDEGVHSLAADLGACTYGTRVLVAAWMLDHGWTEPLDDEGTEAGTTPEAPDLREAAQAFVDAWLAQSPVLFERFMPPLQRALAARQEESRG